MSYKKYVISREGLVVGGACDSLILGAGCLNGELPWRERRVRVLLRWGALGT